MSSNFGDFLVILFFNTAPLPYHGHRPLSKGSTKGLMVALYGPVQGTGVSKQINKKQGLSNHEHLPF